MSIVITMHFHFKVILNSEERDNKEKTCGSLLLSELMLCNAEEQLSYGIFY